MSSLSVLGIGNALTDYLIRATDEMLAQHGLPKGSMQLVNQTRAQQLLSQCDADQSCAGGCVSNTITGLGELGINTAFIGKVGRDPIGEAFDEDLKLRGVESRLIRSDSPSGTALAFITPDSERTFATYLGAAVELCAADLHADLFRNADHIHIEGYLVQNHALITKAVELAKATSATVSIDLASYNVVEENLDFLKSLVGSGLDIVFANEEEAKSFTGKEEEEALEHFASLCNIAVVKLGDKGSLIARGNERYRVGIQPAQAIDSTGAGDLYATGFLYGLVMGLDLVSCGKIAALTASEVIQIMGTKLPPEAWQRVKATLADLQG